MLELSCGWHMEAGKETLRCLLGLDENTGLILIYKGEGVGRLVSRILYFTSAESG